MNRLGFFTGLIGGAMTFDGGDAKPKYAINDIYKDCSPDALQQFNDYLSSVNPLNVSLSNVRGYQGTAAMVIVGRQELTASGTFDFNPIPQGFAHLRLLVYARSTVALTSDEMWLRFNADAGNNYYWEYLFKSNTDPANGGRLGPIDYILAGGCPAASGSSGFFTTLEIVIPFYRSANKKSMHRINYHLDTTTTPDQLIAVGGGSWDSTSAITRIQLFPFAGSFAAGSIATLYAQN